MWLRPRIDLDGDSYGAGLGSPRINVRRLSSRGETPEARCEVQVLLETVNVGSTDI